MMRKILPPLFVVFVDNFCLALPMILFPALLLKPEWGFLPDQSLHIRGLCLGISFCVYPFAQFFAAPLLGDIADRCGRKKTLLLTLTGLTLAVCGTGVGIVMKSFWQITLWRFLNGFFSGNQVIALAALADVEPDEKKRGKLYGFYGTMLGISWNVAMLMGGYLLLPSPSLSYWIATVQSALGIWIVAAYFQETTKQSGPLKFDLFKGIHNVNRAFHMKSVHFLFGMYFLWALAWLALHPWVASYGIDIYHQHQSAIGWGLFSFGTAWTVSSLILNPLFIRWMPIQKILATSYALTALMMFGMSLITTFPIFIFFYCLAGIFAVIAMTNTLNYISLLAPDMKKAPF